MRGTSLLFAVGAALLSGCSSGGAGVVVQDVTDIPAGNATGTAASGTYQVSVEVESCSGQCTAEDLGTTFSLCTAPSTQTATMEVVQANGTLTARATSGSLYVDDFSGGIDSDGSFDLGGESMEADGSDVSVTSEVQGEVTGDVLTGDVQTLGVGTVNGTAINCIQEASIVGMRSGK